jgi:hypothetical protein
MSVARRPVSATEETYSGGDEDLEASFPSATVILVVSTGRGAMFNLLGGRQCFCFQEKRLDVNFCGDAFVVTSFLVVAGKFFVSS